MCKRMLAYPLDPVQEAGSTLPQPSSSQGRVPVPGSQEWLGAAQGPLLGFRNQRP